MEHRFRMTGYCRLTSGLLRPIRKRGQDANANDRAVLLLAHGKRFY